MSVIVSTNRGGPHLRAAVDSVFAQVYTSWELIIVNDGASDVGQIEDAISGRDRTKLIHQKPSGLSIGRNVGIANSSGTLLAFLDDDDIWATNRLEVQVAAMVADPDAIACYSAIWYTNSEGIRTGSGELAQAADDLAILSGRYIPRIVTLMVRRAAIDRIGGFNPLFVSSEDLDFEYRLATQGRFVAVAGELVGYRRHDRNMTNNIRRSVSTGTEAVRVQLWSARERGDIRRSQALRLNLRNSRRYYAELCGSHVISLAHDHRGSEMARMFWYAIRRYPVGLPAFFIRRLSRRLSRKD